MGSITTGSETIALEQILAQYSFSELIPSLIGMILGFLLVAFFGYRLFKLSIIILAVSLGYTFGAVSLGALVGDAIPGFDVTVILGIACALVFGLLSLKIYKALIYFSGALLGAFIGFCVPVVAFFVFGHSSLFILIGFIIGIVLGVVLAVLGAKLVYKIFKPYIIITTSLIGSVFAAITVSLLIYRENEAALGAFTLAGLVLAVIAMVVQFRMNRGKEFNL